MFKVIPHHASKDSFGASFSSIYFLFSMLDDVLDGSQILELFMLGNPKEILIRF